MDGKVMGRGVPTEAELKKLGEKFGVPKIGDRISYAAIGAVIGAFYGSHRFTTVTVRWRKLLEREHNVLLVPVKSWGFEAADNSGRIRHASHRVTKGFRSIRRGSRLAGRTDRSGLTSDELRQQDHLCKIGAAVELAKRTAPKTLNFHEPEK